LWISGEESTTNETFNSTERSLLTTFLTNGGKLFVSGAEIGWHLDASGADPTFYNNVLRADFVSDDAASYTTTGVAGSIFNGLTSVAFDNGADTFPGRGSFLTYDVETPDVLAAVNGSTAALTYSPSGAVAAVQFSSGNTRLVNMGFPFETITSVTKRNQVMSGVLNYFSVNDTLTSSTPGTPDLVAASDTGSSNIDNLTRLDNSTPANALQFLVTGTVSGATVSLYLNGITLIGTAVATGTTTTVTTNGTLDLPDGVRGITARQTETGKSQSAASAALNITVDTAAPTVQNVFVSSTAWTPAYLTSLAAGGAGEAAFGYRIDPSEQTRTVAWSNLNTISVRFNGAVNVASDDLSVAGVNLGAYGLTGFVYDAATFTATWLLDRFIPNDKITLTVDGDAGGAVDAAGNLLDGEWSNPLHPAYSGDTFPSGDGTPGGDFAFNLRVLPGDINRDGSVNGLDSNILRPNLNLSGMGVGGGDINGDGLVSIVDYNEFRAYLNKTTPA
jgi:hypothetical protein